jgi:hypothetical protein
MRFKIPYYAQSAEFTWEFEVWRQCNMIGAKGADPFGMSVPLLDAGYEVHLVTQRRRMIDLDLWKQRPRAHEFTPEDARLAVFGIAENRKRALGRGLTLEYRRLTVEGVARSCSEGFIPIALVHMGVVHQLDIPHWVAVTDAGEDHVAFNDPYPPKGGKGIRVCREGFQKMLDDVGTRIGLSPSVIFVRSVKSVKEPT